MAYAHKVLRATLFGTMYNGQEEWSTGFFLGHPGADAAAPDEAAAEALWNHWATFFTAATTHVSWAWLSTGAKLSLINLDGKTDLQNVVTHHPGAAVAGGAQVTGFPPQVALVGSLIAGPGKGVGMKGRMYIPGVCHAVMGDGHIHWDRVQEVSLNFQTFINEVNDDPAIPGFVLNASTGNPTKGYAPVNKVITEIRVGNVYDTQRRRRNQLAEGYSNRVIGAA